MSAIGDIADAGMQAAQIGMKLNAQSGGGEDGN